MQQAPAQNKSRFFWEGEQRGKVKTTENNKTAREGGCSIQERAHTKLKKGAHKSCNTLQHCNATCCNGNAAKIGMVTTAEDDKGLLTIANQCWEN